MPSKKKNKKRGTSIEQKNRRIKALFIVFVLMSFGVIGRLYYLQIENGDKYSALARGQRGIGAEVLPPRGDIYFQDKAGADTFLAAANRNIPMAYANPREVSDEGFVAGELMRILDLSESETSSILERIENKDMAYTILARGLSKEQAEEIKELGMRGIHITEEQVRFYPSDSVAAHSIGFLGYKGNERAGQYGVEEYYNDILSGKASLGFSLNNLLPGNTNAANIELTIDYGAQFMVERKLKELVDRWSPDEVSAIFMNPKTGEIIAMAHIPGFDPNNYRDVDDISVFNNNITQSVYELGSVFKPITVAAAIDSGSITPQTTYEDEGSIRIGSYTIRNSDREAHGEKTMTEALELSLNVGMVFAQQAMGKKPFRDYLEGFLLDQRTGIDLPGEARGNIDNIQNTNRDINFATASFGQGISFTPLRFLASISAIANEGVIMKPHIVKRVDHNGSITETEPEEIASPISSMTASRVTAMMVSTIEDGFGDKAAVPGYSVAGKTGTAQIPNPDSAGYSDRTLHSFVGFAPAYNPRFVGIIVMNNPKGVRFSSDSTAPAFGEIASFLLQYYKVPPQ
ncbi:MAG: penicillin-binding protein 2 [Candidatus Spechtbacterales bacterium]